MPAWKRPRRRCGEEGGDPTGSALDIRRLDVCLREQKQERGHLEPGSSDLLPRPLKGRTFSSERNPSPKKEHLLAGARVRPTASSALYHPLDQILGSPALVRVVRVLADHGGSLGVADIARRARLALPSTREALRRLLKADVISAVGAGRSMVCALRAGHPLVGALVTLFAAERQQMEFVLSGIRTAASRLEPAPLAVWLFGSVARREDDASSVMDIALVSALSDPSSQSAAFRTAIREATPERELRVAILALAPADIRRLAGTGGAMWNELQRDAAVLLGNSVSEVLERVSMADPS